jgi:type II secretion system protein H
MRKHKHGFTYLEILIVIVIIAILSSASLLVIGDFGASRRLRAQLQQLQALLYLAEHRAIVTATAIGLQLTPSGYRFHQYSAQQTWQPMTASMWRFHTWPPQTTYRLQPEASTQTKALTPQIIAYPNGELSAFTLKLYSQQTQVAVLHAQQNGEMDVKT